MELRGRVMLAMSAILACASAAHLRRPCEDSGYCSVGVSKAWRGDIKESSQFKAMLESVTYKKELILTTYQKNGPPYTHADEVLQLHSELMTMGYAHHILVTLGPEHCESVPNDDLSCVWDSDLLPWDIQGPFWAIVSLRWKVLARAIRLGYNVMGLDSDFIFYSDPYTHLKNPPLNTIHMMCHPEGGSPFNCNAGFIYVQNVRPDGPISWVWREYVRMTRRLADDGYKFASQFTGEKKNCFEHEQLQIGQALATATVGRPAYHGIVEYCKRHYNLTTRVNSTLTGAEAGELLSQIVHAPKRVKYVEVLPNDAFMRRVGFRDLPQASKVMQFAQMTVPNLNYVNPEELGGRIFPDPGSLSKAWDDMLKSDCPECPWWNDLRPLPNSGVDPVDQILGSDFKSVHVNTTQLNLFVDPSIPQETYAQTPGWLISSLTLGRWGTILGRNAPRPGFPVLSHVHFWHMQTERDQKSMLRKVVGRYNYTVGEQVAKAGGFASPYMMGQAVKRVLILSPEIDLSRTRTGKEFAHILAGLFQLAALSHRTLVLPSLPCQTNWLHDPWLLSHESSNKTLCLVPMVNTQRWPIPFPLAVDNQGELVGGWARRSLRGSQERMEDGWWDRQRFTMILPQMWDPSCTRGHHAIILPEFHHWRKNNPATRDVHLWPVPGNTVFLPSSTSSKLSLNPPSPASGDSAAVPPGHVVQSSDAPGWSLYDIQAAVPVDQAVQAMRQFFEEPILYVGHPVSVVASKEQEAAAAVGGATHTQRRLAAAEGLGSHGHMHVSPAAALQRVNSRLSNSRCKTIWEDSEQASSGKVVDLSHGIPVEVVDGKYLRQTPEITSQP